VVPGLKGGGGGDKSRNLTRDGADFPLDLKYVVVVGAVEFNVTINDYLNMVGGASDGSGFFDKLDEREKVPAESRNKQRVNKFQSPTIRLSNESHSGADSSEISRVASCTDRNGARCGVVEECQIVEHMM
jgi:hypothetical protein